MPRTLQRPEAMRVDPVDLNSGQRWHPPCRPPPSARSVETFCPAANGVSAARIEEAVVQTPDGARIITLFPATGLPVSNRY